MCGKFNKFIVCIVLFVMLSTNTSFAQILRDSNSLELVKKEIDCIYRLQFTNADRIYAKIARMYPGHPVVLLLRGLSTFWKNYPFLQSNPAHISFEEDLRRCISLSGNSTNPANEAEFLLANLCARGMLLKYYSDNNLTLKTIPLVSGMYKYLRRSFNYTNVCSDLYYYTGVYNYYREAYPKIYPVYKPLAMLLPAGNMETGLKQLHIAADKAVVLKAESYLLLSWIYLNFENKYEQALYFSKALHDMYPDNMTYEATYIKNLLLMKQYDEAEKIITKSSKVTENKFFQAQLTIFKGILQEKKYRDNTHAREYYFAGINKAAPFGDYANEYTAYAYFGLSRISNAGNEKEMSKKYREKALKLGDFKKLNFDS
jgi:tetratricopeptide (TPR) repeat protein